MAIGQESRSVVQLVEALQEAGVRFMLAGMSAANLQGVMVSTIDVDIWIGLPSRQYMRVINICNKLGATIASRNKVYLADDTPVDFIYEVTGLPPFDREYPRAKWLSFHGAKVPILPLERICKSKAAAGRDKDKLQVLLIRRVLRGKRALKNHSSRRQKIRSSKRK